jgi:phage terminase Nu1 subunit (DNA packaging protein)
MLQSELTEETNLYEGSAEEARSDKETDIPNIHRIRLLARRYARNSLTPEESARLDILNERVQQLVPSVTDEEVDDLGQMVNKLHEIAAADEALRKRLGMT